MTSHELPQDPREHAEEILANVHLQLQKAVEIVAPEQAEADPLTVFPKPGQVRAEDTGLVLDEAQEQALRAVAGELGVGREEDKTLSSMNLYDADVVLHGGQPHKILAEAQMVLEDEQAKPARIFFAASPFRKLTNEAEKASAQRLLGEVPETEYDVAYSLAQKLPGFTPEEYDLPYSYDINNDFVVSNETSGQFKMIGWVKDVPIILLKIDREDYLEGDKPKYRNQPTPADTMLIVDAIQRQEGDTERAIAFATSATYEPSCTVDATIADLQMHRPARVVTYGTARLAEVKGDAAPLAPGLNQIPGELHKVALQAAKLQTVIDS